MCAGLKDAVQSTEAQAGSQRPSVSGISENVQEGIDSAAENIKAGSRRTEQYAAEPEKVNDVLGYMQFARDYMGQGNAQRGAYEGGWLLLHCSRDFQDRPGQSQLNEWLQAPNAGFCKPPALSRSILPPEHGFWCPAGCG